MNELTFVKQELKEENHLVNLSKKFRGWYKFVLEDKGFIDVVVWFRLPPTIPLYKDVLRNFTLEERLAGLHRMLIGKDLQEETKKILEHESLNEYLETLSDEETKNLLNKMKDIVTFDCNKISYLHIRIEKEKYNEKETNLIIKNFLDNQIDYLDIFYDVLNEKISIKEANKLSNGIIYGELINISGLGE